VTLDPQPKPPGPTAPSWTHIAVDYGALVVFGVAVFIRHGIDSVATIVLMAASVIAVAAGYILERRVAPLPLISAVFSVGFGGLSLVLHDKQILKMKLTFLEGGLGAALLIGLAMRRNLLKMLLGEAVRLPDPAWRTLTLRYAAFFLLAALANEIVRNTMSDMAWVWFKGGVVVAAVVFSLAQTPFLMKHMQTEAPEPVEPPDTGF
jgi:intracellular septation protein